MPLLLLKLTSTLLMFNNLLHLQGEGVIVSLCTGLPETLSFFWEVTLIGEAVSEDMKIFGSNWFKNKTLIFMFTLMTSFQFYTCIFTKRQCFLLS